MDQAQLSPSVVYRLQVVFCSSMRATFYESTELIWKTVSNKIREKLNFAQRNDRTIFAGT